MEEIQRQGLQIQHSHFQVRHVSTHKHVYRPNPFLNALDCLLCRTYMRLDRTIIERSTKYQKLKDDVEIPIKRKRPAVDTTSPSASEPPIQVFVVGSDSEGDDE